jgi:hypothetical protein
VDGEITAKDDSGNLSLESQQGPIQVNAGDVLSITKLGL